MGGNRSADGRRAARALGAGCWAVIGLIACHAAAAAAPDTKIGTVEPRQNADALLIVDCVLQAQVHQLGTGISYVAPRRAIKTSASDCAIRGGEYVAYDRASIATALRVWLPQAESGDKVAQTNVGEIYEKGSGTAPDYVNAAKWYQKAADQGYPRALTNLGFLYEQGLGVRQGPGRGAETLPEGGRHRRHDQPRQRTRRPRPRRISTPCARNSTERGRTSRRPVVCLTRNGSSRVARPSACSSRSCRLLPPATPRRRAGSNRC